MPRGRRKVTLEDIIASADFKTINDLCDNVLKLTDELCNEHFVDLLPYMWINHAKKLAVEIKEKKIVPLERLIITSEELFYLAWLSKEGKLGVVEELSDKKKVHEKLWNLYHVFLILVEALLEKYIEVAIKIGDLCSMDEGERLIRLLKGLKT
ncbi:MAG: hypothetical protein DRJ40_08445 [Thermoprotei archaeon]|nr:MAG: hypothetical protein DRJ40_08445 [Thermoprotei archaeon]